jgi:hypothetical protein
VTLYPPPQHARRENNFYKRQVDLAAGLLAGLRRAGLTLPAPLHDPCAGDAALLDGLGFFGSGSDPFPAAHPSDARLLLAPVDARSEGAGAGPERRPRACLESAFRTRPPNRQEHGRVGPCRPCRDGRAPPTRPVGGREHPEARGADAGDGSPHCLLLATTWVEETAGRGKLNYAWHVWRAP